MKIEFADKGDESLIKQLLAECGLPYEDVLTSDWQHFLVVRDGNQLVGVVGIEMLKNFGLLRSLDISPIYRGQGIASQLVRQAEEYAKSYKKLEPYIC